MKRWIEYDGFINDYVFKSKRNENHVYIVTNTGLKIMLDAKNRIINSSLTSIFNNHLIMDLEFLGKHLYLLSDYGFFQYNFQNPIKCNMLRGFL